MAKLRWTCWLLLCTSWGLCAGCAWHRAYSDVEPVACQVGARLGQEVALPTLAEPLLPPALAQGIPLSEDQAVLAALWNNPSFHEQLAELHLTRADLIQADLLPNPEVAYFFQVPNKPFKYAIEFPLEALWLRPFRLKVAALEHARVQAKLVQIALDLIRDTRQAYTDLQLAHARLKIGDDTIALRAHIATFSAKRLRAGDVSVQEDATAQIDQLQARQDRVRLAHDVTLAEEKLRGLLGLAAVTLPIRVEASSAPVARPLDPEELVRTALRERPDAQAAGLAVGSAAERLRLAKCSWVRFLGILDATSGRRTGHEFGPGFRATVPLFNRNQGGIARAEAEWTQAQRREETLRQQIQIEVRTAHTRYRQAHAELAVLETQVKREVQEAIARALKSYNSGSSTYLVVLTSSRQLLDTQLREAQLHAEARRAWADLERSVSRRLQALPVEPEACILPLRLPS